jgi:hypothetical protein
VLTAPKRGKKFVPVGIVNYWHKETSERAPLGIRHVCTPLEQTGGKLRIKKLAGWVAWSFGGGRITQLLVHSS